MTVACPQDPSQVLKGWSAKLDVQYSTNEAGKTVVSSSKHCGPLRIQRPFHPEGPVNHTYLLHPPGGLVAGDELDVAITVAENAHALITTPGATKVYLSNSGVATIKNHLKVSGALEWFPQETILFDGSRASGKTMLHFGAQARCFAWEIVCLGRPAGNFHYQSGLASLVLSVENKDGLKFYDALRLDDSVSFRTSPWGLNRKTVIGTMIAYPVNEPMLAQVQALLDAVPDVEATALDDLLVVRGLGHHGWELRQAFCQVWSMLRPILMQRPACIPRIWNT